MASKVFDWLILEYTKGQVNIHNNSLSCHLVTAEPANNAETVADIVLPVTGGSYAYKTLVDISNNSSNRVAPYQTTGAKLVMQNPLWPALTTGDNAPIVGLVIVHAYTPSSSSKVLCYLEREVSGTPTPYTPNGMPFAFDLSTNGFLQVIKGV